jgi:hypothetical protein
MPGKGGHIRSLVAASTLLAVLTALIISAPSFLGTTPEALAAFTHELETKVSDLAEGDAAREVAREKARYSWTGADFTPESARGDAHPGGAREARAGSVFAAIDSTDRVTDGTMVLKYGMTAKAFDEIAEIIAHLPDGAPLADTTSRKPYHLDHRTTLALTLRFLRGTGNSIDIGDAFHVRPDNVPRIIERGLRLLDQALTFYPWAAVDIPHKDQICIYSDCMTHGEYELPAWVAETHKPWCMSDGYVVEIPKCGDKLVERSFWNVKNEMDSVLCIRIVTPDGLVIKNYGNLAGGASEWRSIDSFLNGVMRNPELNIKYGMVVCDTAYRVISGQDVCMATHSAGETPENWAGGDPVLNNVLGVYVYRVRQFVGTSCARRV